MTTKRGEKDSEENLAGFCPDFWMGSSSSTPPLLEDAIRVLFTVSLATFFQSLSLSQIFSLSKVNCAGRRLRSPLDALRVFFAVHVVSACLVNPKGGPKGLLSLCMLIGFKGNPNGSLCSWGRISHTPLRKKKVSTYPARAVQPQ